MGISVKIKHFFKKKTVLKYNILKCNKTFPNFFHCVKPESSQYCIIIKTNSV